MRYLWLVLAFLCELGGVLLGRALSLSGATTMILAVTPALLLLFPFMKPWIRETRFAEWVLATLITATIAWLLFVGLSRAGW